MGGKTPGCSAIGRHDEQVEIAIAVTGEGNLLLSGDQMGLHSYEACVVSWVAVPPLAGTL